MKNLHVVFTMNPSSEGLKDRAATSPALFNRCVLNWFGDWSDSALYQVRRSLFSLYLIIIIFLFFPSYQSIYINSLHTYLCIKKVRKEVKCSSINLSNQLSTYLSYLIKVGKEFTIKMDLDLPTWRAPDYFPVACPGPSPTPSHRFVCVCVCVFVCVCMRCLCVCLVCKCVCSCVCCWGNEINIKDILDEFVIKLLLLVIFYF